MPNPTRRVEAALLDSEQSRKAVRLAAMILFWRTNVSAKGRGRVPGPAGIIQHRTCERDQVGVAICDNCFGVFVVVNQADGYYRDLKRGLDRARERHLIARCDGNSLSWM